MHKYTRSLQNQFKLEIQSELHIHDPPPKFGQNEQFV